MSGEEKLVALGILVLALMFTVPLFASRKTGIEECVISCERAGTRLESYTTTKDGAACVCGKKESLTP